MATATKRRPTSGRIKKERRCDEWSVFDANGNYLGWTQDRNEAILMAETGHTNQAEIESAPAVELDFWDMWNNLVSRDTRVWDCGDGTQAIYLFDGVFLLARHDESLGWEVELLACDDLWSRYGDPDNDNILAVTVAEKPHTCE